MKKQKAQFKILNLSRRNNSYYGNPAYSVVLENQDGDILHAKTASDAACGYSISNFNDKLYHVFTYHYTKNNNLIIDDIRK